MNRILATVLLAVASPTLYAQSVQLDAADGKLRGDLAESLAAAEGKLVPVAIVLKEQAPEWLMDAARDIPDKEARREFVIETLQELAEDTQAGILTQLEAGQAQNTVGPNVTSLWIANAIIAQVDEDTALELASREDVAWLNHDKPRGEEILVSSPAAPALGGPIECGTDLMGSDEVWNTYGITGGDVIVAVIDTGLCPTHPGISDRLWTNTGEILGNGVDDDNNGFIDDRHGWNFESNNENISDLHGHGSHTAGTVAGTDRVASKWASPRAHASWSASSGTTSAASHLFGKASSTRSQMVRTSVPRASVGRTALSRPRHVAHGLREQHRGGSGRDLRIRQRRLFECARQRADPRRCPLSDHGRRNGLQRQLCFVL